MPEGVECIFELQTNYASRYVILCLWPTSMNNCGHALQPVIYRGVFSTGLSGTAQLGGVLLFGVVNFLPLADGVEVGSCQELPGKRNCLLQYPKQTSHSCFMQ